MRAWSALVLAAWLGCHPAASPARHEAPILGGQEDLGNPGIVLLFNLVTTNLCSGVAVSTRVVLTAKHCVLGTVAADWRVLVGEEPLLIAGRLDEYVGAELRTTDGEGTFGEDVAAVVVDRDFEHPTYPWAAALPEGFGDGATVTVWGYGRTDAADPDSGGRKFQLAGAVYGLDAVTFSADVNACSGDSGGPAIDGSGTVVGVVSSSADGCLGQTVMNRLDTVAGVIQSAIDGGDGDADADADADADSDSDGDADSDEDDTDAGAGGDADSDGDTDTDDDPDAAPNPGWDAGTGGWDSGPGPEEMSAGCGCRFVH